MEKLKVKPGDSWSDPIWWRNYRIYKSESSGPFNWAYSHDDFDGAPDSNDFRYGFSMTVEEAKENINELEGED